MRLCPLFFASSAYHSHTAAFAGHIKPPTLRQQLANAVVILKSCTILPVRRLSLAIRPGRGESHTAVPLAFPRQRRFVTDSENGEDRA